MATIVGITLGMDHFSVPKGFAVVLIFTGVYLVTMSKAAPASCNKESHATMGQIRNEKGKTIFGRKSFWNARRGLPSAV